MTRDAASSVGPPVRFAVIGLDHPHVFTQAHTLCAAGAELVAYCGREGDLSPLFEKAHPDARKLEERRAILEDESIDLVVTAAVPDERADVAVAALRAGKDVLADKPGAVTLEELGALRRAVHESGRRWWVYFSERLENAATVRAAELVSEGAIGEVVHTTGFGPHRIGPVPRPGWFWEPARSGGILGDLASHQVDQFLHFTGSDSAEIESATVANRVHRERPAFEDVGELLLRSEKATGYARVDWFTPDGLPTWGDVRLHVVGTAGTLEVRKNCDPAGREGGDHLLLVDGEGVRHFDCKGHPLPFGPALLRDVRERTETALGQEHCLLASELALRAQAQARRLGHLAD